MDNRKRTYANIALIVAAAALLAALGLWYVQRDFTVWVQVSLGLIIIGTALFVYFDPDRARGLFSARQARYGSNALVLFVAFLGIVVVVNYIIFDNSQDWGLRWDLTEDKQRTLAPETIKTLETLEEPVIVRAFYTARNGTQSRAQDLLDDFKFYGKGNFRYEFINPEEDPIAAQNAGITQDGTLLFSLGGNSEKVTAVSETDFTNAILRLLNPGAETVYFLTGHGELSVDQTGDESLSQVKRALENKNYVVASLNLLVDPAIPPDAAAIVIAGPLQPVSQVEMDLISAFVDAGGALIVAEEPLPLTDFGAAEDPVAAYLLENWGIELGEDLVVDLQAVQLYNSPFIAISAQYGDQPISRDLLQRQLATVFPLARSVGIAEGEIEGVLQTVLVSTSDQSWGETNFESINDGSLAPDEFDTIGPVTLAVAAENAATGGRVVVFGDASFMADSGIQEYGNADLVNNAVDWATEQENLISLTPRDATQRFIVPPSATVVNTIALGTIFVIPGLVLLAGILVWVARRRRA